MIAPICFLVVSRSFVARVVHVLPHFAELYAEGNTHTLTDTSSDALADPLLFVRRVRGHRLLELRVHCLVRARLVGIRCGVGGIRAYVR